ncbi:PilZ domain-containing protein [Methylobacterium phyllostachyos]|uniref:PilZ domain-containing protein n=1 Tax=Methylobacterium phyllostachyos TaxID=582672 RepID=A0A1H0JTU6_9HYPH|nr:PilZ domain-containing protein [Methylobacterium phyllostachyos]SDO46902.1 PilZ domain-containing protein [Methylobacterium phyllostachyos]
MREQGSIAAKGRYCWLGSRDVQCLAAVSATNFIELHPATEGALPEVGERVTCYLDDIGMIDGVVQYQQVDRFVLQIIANPERRSRIEARLAWLRSADDRDDQRKAARIVPVHRKVQVHLLGARVTEAIVADLSMTGAALLLDERPQVGTIVTVGKRYATVVRHTPEGVGVAFRLPFGPLTFNERVIL